MDGVRCHSICVEFVRASRFGDYSDRDHRPESGLVTNNYGLISETVVLTLKVRTPVRIIRQMDDSYFVTVTAASNFNDGRRQIANLKARAFHEHFSFSDCSERRT